MADCVHTVLHLDTDVFLSPVNREIIKTTRHFHEYSLSLSAFVYFMLWAECAALYVLNLHLWRVSLLVSHGLIKIKQRIHITEHNRCFMRCVFVCVCLQDSPNHHHQLLPGKAPGERGWPAERPERKSGLHQPWCIKWWVQNRHV